MSLLSTLLRRSASWSILRSADPRIGTRGGSTHTHTPDQTAVHEQSWASKPGSTRFTRRRYSTTACCSAAPRQSRPRSALIIAFSSCYVMCRRCSVMNLEWSNFTSKAHADARMQWSSGHVTKLDAVSVFNCTFNRYLNPSQSKPRPLKFPSPLFSITRKAFSRGAPTIRPDDLDDEGGAVSNVTLELEGAGDASCARRLRTCLCISVSSHSMVVSVADAARVAGVP